METTNVLHFFWTGDDKGIKGMSEQVLFLYVNGTEYVADWDYSEGFSLDVPISGTKLDIEVKIGKNDSDKRGTYFKHQFEIQPNADYSASLEGQVSSFSGLKLKLSKPNEEIEDNSPFCKRNLPVAILSFTFPIYGVIDAIRSPYNRKAAIIAAFVGFELAMLFSAFVPEGGETGIGFGQTMIISYKPFSFLDCVCNLLIGGIASLRGFLYMILETIFLS